MKVRFTAARINTFHCPKDKKTAFLWDSDTTGLGLKASPGGSKKYVLESRLKSGESIRLTIGSPSTWSISAAQAEARRLQSLIDQGNDPRQVAAAKANAAAQLKADEAAADQRRVLLVGEAWNAYIAYQKDKMGRTHIERGKRWGARHLADHENLSQPGGEKKKRGEGLTRTGVIYPLLQMRMVDINAEMLKDWQRREAQTRANNARQGF